MKPAFSVIFFTSASGAGYGLLFVTALLLGFDLFPADRPAALAALLLALGLITLGLLSSTLHLGRPGRAWRAFSQWRSSWLSREGVLAVLTYAPHIALAAALLQVSDNRNLHLVLCLAAALGALSTVFCTAMIYASLRAIRQWHHRLVPPVYLLMGLMSGLYWLLAIVRFAGTEHLQLSFAAATSLVLAWSLKSNYWKNIDTTTPASTIGSATGLPGSVRVFDPPHTEKNYLLSEMGFRIGRRHRRKLRRQAIVLGALLPLLLTALQLWWAPAALLAALAVSAGVIIERWLFFAEAEHTVTLFYDRQGRAPQT